ncbi:cell surface protein [Bifidobacterium ruminantium]|nr:DUF6466 family protein [Bifidobacterium ruminantium]MBU9112114.1 cell surface protein [Bifidobacterium ruminantium]
MAGAVKEAVVSGKLKRTRASLPTRVALIVLAVLLGTVALLAVVNLAANGNYNHATRSLQENIKTSKQNNVDWDKLRVQQQQTDAQFDDAGEMRALLLPQLRESIDHNSRVSGQLTKAIIEKAKSGKDDQSDSDTNANADARQTNGSESKKDTRLTDAQREKVEELLKQNTQSTQSDSNTNGSAANQNTDKSSSQTKPW